MQHNGKNYIYVCFSQDCEIWVNKLCGNDFVKYILTKVAKGNKRNSKC